MIPRALTARIVDAIAHSPADALLGPPALARASGPATGQVAQGANLGTRRDLTPFAARAFH